MSTRLGPRPRQFGALLATAALLAVTLPASTVAADASTVRDWNAHAAAALMNPATASPQGANQPAPVGEVHLAMVQAAVYDAVIAIGGGYDPFLVDLPDSPGASVDAAAATAAHHVLVGLTGPAALPLAVRTWVDTAYATALAGIPAGSAKTAGINLGSTAAAAILSARESDGRYGTFRFRTGTGPGEWRGPSAPVGVAFDWLAEVRPFTFANRSKFRSDGPPALASEQYATDFNEVKAVGSASSSVRTAEQTDLARFFVANPISMWNESLRGVAEAKGLSLLQEARLFALVNVAGADALISCWVDKAHWSFWRPNMAIHAAATDGNPATEADGSWTPLISNPPYPDHPSGYNCATGSMLGAAKAFFRTNQVEFTAASNAPNVVQRTRHYVRLSDACHDTIDARIYLGIHFRTADVQAVVMGRKVAHWVAKHYFQPIR